MGQLVGAALNVNEYVFPAVNASYGETHELLVHFPAGSVDGAAVPAMYIRPERDWKDDPGDQSARPAAVCVIYFHANACDIGECLEDMFMVRDGVFDGCAAVLAPEYAGYGLFSEYEPSVDSIDLVARAAWRFCTGKLGFKSEHIVLWGRSIGSGPAASLARLRAVVHAERSAATAESHSSEPLEASTTDGQALACGGCRHRRSLAGIVLLAPFTSVADVVQHHTNGLIASLVPPLWDVADLLREPALRDVPLCVMHPTDDEVVPLAHGQAVLGGAASAIRCGLWLKQETHNFFFRHEYAALVSQFLVEHIPIFAEPY